jgi:hypothetical protein
VVSCEKSTFSYVDGHWLAEVGPDHEAFDCGSLTLLVKAVQSFLAAERLIFIVHAYFGLVKMKRYQLSDEEIRDLLYQTATLIGKALHLVHNLADGFVSFPEKDDARTQLIDSCIQLSRVR